MKVSVALSLILWLIAPGMAFGWTIQPNVSAPPGEFGASIVGSYETRTLSSLDVIVKRPVARLSWATKDNLALWGEAGIGSLRISGAGSPLEGDYGAAFGLGMVGTLPQFSLSGWRPFSAVGWILLGSTATQENTNVSPIRTRTSDYTWQEVCGQFGAWKPLSWGEIGFGLGLRFLDQSEDRTIKNGTYQTTEQFSYQSGIKPGGFLGITIPCKPKFVLQAGIEVYQDGTKATIGFGEWGWIERRTAP